MGLEKLALTLQLALCEEKIQVNGTHPKSHPKPKQFVHLKDKK
mgnify:CR=1 FL=1